MRMAKAEKILVIDDDPTVCAVVSGLARSMGIECTAAKDPGAFPDLLTRDTSLIVLDLMMPGMDGIEVLRMLGERRSTARILLLSGMDQRVLETAEKLAQSLGLWVVGRLQKPCPLPVLKEAFETLGAFRSPQSPDKSPDPALSDDQLRDAFTNGQIVNYYQPQISLSTGMVTGIEVLSRWLHPERGLILPEHFIPRLAAMDLMDNLCWYAIDLALRQTGRFCNGNSFCISFNATIGSLQHLDFPDRLLAMARQYAVPAADIVIEVTESGLAHEAHTLDVLTRLRMKGFQLSIDDFGAGFAMMRQVQNIPATELKIDRSLVETMHVNLSDRVMVDKIIEMGHELGMNVVAEGVATLQQLELLRHSGCDHAQGFLFSRPLPADELSTWLSIHPLQQRPSSH
jgi:EAL domain-containing protein (putative c-di-GMP-specific phosphodiesterase class I)